MFEPIVRGELGAGLLVEVGAGLAGAGSDGRGRWWGVVGLPAL